MAPRALESKAAFLERLRAAWRADGSARVAFGAHHFTHAVVLECGRVRVRRLEVSKEKADAQLAQHGSFMPEHAEQLSEPTGLIAYDAGSLDELIQLIRRGPWPL
jgi:hypothetical protein